MSFSNQDILSVRHYSQLKPMICSVVSGTPDSFFTIKVTEPVALNDSISKGDPIIFGSFAENDDISISGGSVIAFVESENNIVISPDKVYAGSERRQFERFPVSMFCDMTCNGERKKRYHAFIKDMSYSGIRIYSEVELSQGDSVEIDVFLQSSMLNIAGTIMRKSMFYGRNEYGVQLVFRDKSAIYATQEFMDKLMVNEKDILKKQLVKNMVIHAK